MKLPLQSQTSVKCLHRMDKALTMDGLDIIVYWAVQSIEKICMDPIQNFPIRAGWILSADSTIQQLQ